jgi:hypothetical protein
MMSNDPTTTTTTTRKKDDQQRQSNVTATSNDDVDDNNDKVEDDDGYYYYYDHPSPSSAESDELHIFLIRELLRYTCELLDVFGPIYDPDETKKTKKTKATTTKKNYNTESGPTKINGTIYSSMPSSSSSGSFDLWNDVRFHLNRGYDLLGMYQRVVLSENNYNDYKNYPFGNDDDDDDDDEDSPAVAAETVVGSVKEWKDSFMTFHRTHESDLIQYLSNPTNDAAWYHRTDDELEFLYWDHIYNDDEEEEEDGSSISGSSINNMTGNDLATSVLSVLGQYQLMRIQKQLQELTSPDLTGKHIKSALWTAYPFTPKAQQIHDTVRRIRRELRVVTDEQDLFQDFFIPSNDLLPGKSMVLLKETRALLGAINDEWNKLNDEYSFLEKEDDDKKDSTEKKKTSSKIKASVRSLNVMWKGFQGWVATIDLESAIQDLIDCMERNQRRDEHP